MRRLVSGGCCGFLGNLIMCVLQDDCLSSLTRFSSACWTAAPLKTVHTHFIRLLSGTNTHSLIYTQCLNLQKRPVTDKHTKISTIKETKCKRVPRDYFTDAFVRLLKSASEESFRSLCNEDRAEKEKAFFPSSVRTDGTTNVMMS